MADIAWMNPAVHVSRALFSDAADQIEKLAEWLEQHIIAARYGR